MSNPEFQFNFKFKLHKTSIPIGIDDEDYPRLSVIYGVPLDELMEEVRDVRASNSREAANLMEEYSAAISRLKGKRIAFLGDSITSDQKSYMNVIRAALSEEPDIQILDASVSGFKTIDLITNLVPLVTDFRPDIVHIMIGSNDMKRTVDSANMILIPPEEYRRELHYLIQRLMRNGAKIVLSTLPPFDAKRIYASFNDVNVQYTAADRNAYNEVVRSEAMQSGCILNEMEPLYGKHSTEKLTENDGLHLNLLGQKLLARHVFEKLIEAARQV